MTQPAGGPTTGTDAGNENEGKRLSASGARALQRQNVVISAFRGQDSFNSPDHLLMGKGVARFQKLYNAFAGRDGVISNEKIGIDSILYTPPGRAYDIYPYYAPDGNLYEICYCINDSGVASHFFYKNGADTECSISYPDNVSAVPNIRFIPTYAPDESGLYIAFGPMSGVYRIVCSGGSLLGYLTTIPATSFIMINHGRSWVAPGNNGYIRWSAPGDPTRYQPTGIEDAEHTYGIDYGYSFQDVGAVGSVVAQAMFKDNLKLWWTQSAVFGILGDGNDGSTAPIPASPYGCIGHKGVIEKDNCLHWLSGWGGGTWLKMTLGAGSARDVDWVANIGTAQSQFSIWKVGERIADELAKMRSCDVVHKNVGWDAYSDFAAIPDNLRINLDIKSKPGYVSLGDGSDVITFTPADSLYGTNTSGITYAGAYTSGKTLAKLNDGDPVYPLVSYSAAGYCEYKITLTDGAADTVLDINAVATVKLQFFNDAGTLLSFNSGVTELSLPGLAALAWTTIKFDSPVSTSAIRCLVRYTIRYVHNSASIPTMILDHNRVLTLTGTKVVTSLDLFDVVSTLPTIGHPTNIITLKIGEIIVHGVNNLTATLYTEPATAGSKGEVNGLAVDGSDLGRFYVNYFGTVADGTGGALFYIRAGNTPMAYLAGNTSFTRTSDTRLTDASGTFAALGIQPGDYILIGTTKYYITAVAATTLDIIGVLPASTQYYVFGCATASWSAWTPVIGSDLLWGYPLSSLGINPTGTPSKYYVQAKVVFSLADSGNTAYLEKMFFTFHMGSIELNACAMGHYQDKLYASVSKTGDTVSNNLELVLDNTGEFSIMDGKRATAYAMYRDGLTRVAMGYGIGKQGSGKYFNLGTAGSDVLTIPTVTLWGPRLSGKGIMPLTYRCLFDLLTPATVLAINPEADYSFTNNTPLTISAQWPIT